MKKAKYYSFSKDEACSSIIMEIEVLTDKPLSVNNANYLHIDAKKEDGRVGIKNISSVGTAVTIKPKELADENTHDNPTKGFSYYKNY